MRRILLAAMIGSAMSLPACASHASERPAICDNLPSGDVCAYEAGLDAQTSVDAALQVARDEDRLALIVMGANWCHDSRALAGHFAEGRIGALIEEAYELVYVDVGRKNRNIDVAERFGFSEIVGTPTVIITESDGTVLNLDTAPTWRNAASRSEADIYEYFEGFTDQE